jgi:hypothetical protein
MMQKHDFRFTNSKTRQRPSVPGTTGLWHAAMSWGSDFEAQFSPYRVTIHLPAIALWLYYCKSRQHIQEGGELYEQPQL